MCITDLKNQLVDLSFTNSDLVPTRKNNSHPAAYALLHPKTEKVYVGSTENLYVRINKHKTSLLAGEHKNKNVQKAFNEDTRFDIAFVKTKTVDEAIELEQKLLDTFMPTGLLLNVSPDARIPCKGIKLSEEAKEHLRQKTIEQFSSIEAREKHSLISKELWKDQEYKAKQKSRIYTIEQNENNSVVIKEKWKDPVYRQTMSEARKNPVSIDGIIYNTPALAAKSLNIDPSTIHYRLKNPKKQQSYFYVNKESVV